MPWVDLLGSEGVSSQRSPAPRPSAAGREPILAACISPQASEEVAARSHRSSHAWSKTALEKTLKSPAPKSEGSINTEHKLVNRVEEGISDTRPEAAAAGGRHRRAAASRRGDRSTSTAADT